MMEVGLLSLKVAELGVFRNDVRVHLSINVRQLESGTASMG